MSRKSRKERKQRQQMQVIIIALMAVLVVMASVLIGVASMNEGHDHDHAHDAKVNLKVGTSVSEGDVHFEALEQFKKDVEEKSEGEISVTIYGDSELGKDKELVKSLKEGLSNVDIVLTGVENFSEVDKRMTISSLPFLFDGYESAWAFLDGDIQEKIEESMREQNIRVLAHYSDGFEYMTTTNVIMKTATDVKGKKFVVDKNSPSSESLSKFGIQVVSATQKDISPMLASGQFDGYVGDLQSIFSSNLQMHQKNLMLSYHSYRAQAFAISDKVWKTLTEEQQKIVKDAAEASAFSDRKNVQAKEQGIIKHLETAGMRVFDMEYESFKKDAKNYIASKELMYGDLIQEIIKYLDR